MLRGLRTVRESLFMTRIESIGLLLMMIIIMRRLLFLPSLRWHEMDPTNACWLAAKGGFLHLQTAGYLMMISLQARYTLVGQVRHLCRLTLSSVQTV